MKENNILIFEDEWPTIRGSFDLANQFAFNGKLHFNSISRSQDITFSSWNGIYDAVFVDITLAKNSALDGFYIIKEIQNKKLIDMNKVIVLTGNSKVMEKLKEMKLNVNIKNVLYKPIAFNELTNHLQRILQTEHIE